MSILHREELMLKSPQYISDMLIPETVNGMSV